MTKIIYRVGTNGSSRVAPHGAVDGIGYRRILLSQQVRLLPMARHIGIFLSLLLVDNAAMAASLGDLEVQSVLNQPLQALIAVSDAEKFSAKCFKASLTSLDGESLGATGIKLVKEGSSHKMVLWTDNSIPEPVVNVSVEFTCDKRQKRNYQILLDLAVSNPTPATLQNHNTVEKTDESPAMKYATRTNEIDSPKLWQIGMTLSRTLSSIIPSAAAATLQEDVVNSAKKRIESVRAEMTPFEQETASLLAKQHGENLWGFYSTARQYLYVTLICVGSGILLLWGTNYRASSGKRRTVQRYRATKEEEQFGKECKRTNSLMDVSQPIPYEPTVTPQATVHDGAGPCSTPGRLFSVETIKEQEFVNNLEYFANTRGDLPIYSVEVLLDEEQLVKFWNNIGEPGHAIEILESTWRNVPPVSPIPWQYLLELYQIVGNRRKYTRLAKEFERVFQCDAPAWSYFPHEKTGTSGLENTRMCA